VFEQCKAGVAVNPGSIRGVGEPWTCLEHGYSFALWAHTPAKQKKL
jgi:hypothetical protein